VDEDVNFSVGGSELLEDTVDVGVDGDVAAEGLSSGEVGGELFSFALETLVLVADGEGGAGFGELLGDGPGDAALVGEAEDDGYFAFEVNHDARDPFETAWAVNAWPNRKDSRVKAIRDRGRFLYSGGAG